jgi:YfiH family protein
MPLYQNHLISKHVLAITSTREGGVSTGAFESLNLAFHTGDQRDYVIANRRLLAASIGVEPTSMIYTKQSHSTDIALVTHAECGRGHLSFEDGIAADALYTKEANVPLAIFHADCVPVFVVHQHLPLIALIHAGTPGSIKKITFKTIQHLVKHEHINAADLIVYLGPSLDFAHHPIQQERTKTLLAEDPSLAQVIKTIAGKDYLDIPLLNTLQLVDAGVLPQSIHVLNQDTYSNPKTFFSFDRDTITGRHISLLMIKT